MYLFMKNKQLYYAEKNINCVQGATEVKQVRTNIFYQILLKLLTKHYI